MDLAIETSVPYQNGVVSNGESIQDPIIDPDSASAQESAVDDQNSVKAHPENKEKTHGTDHLHLNRGVHGEKEISEWINGSSNNEVNGSGWISVDGAPVALPAVPEQPWIAPKRHTFYLIRIPRSVDEKLRNEIRLAEAKLELTVKKRDAHKVSMQEIKTRKFELLDKLKPLREKERACFAAIQGKRTEMEPFSVALNKFRSVHSNGNTNVRGKGQEICSSEEELNERIGELEYRIEHESISLKEEKQLMRDIKQLESTRSQVCANTVLQQELTESLGLKENIQDQYKFLRQDMDGIKKEHSLASAECHAIDKEISILNSAIDELRELYDKANAAQQDAFAALRELKKQENSKNDPFFQNKRDIQTAKELAMQRKPEELEKFCLKNVEVFMGTWNNNNKFRADYIKSNERSTIRRLDTLDGRSLGPGEKPPQIIDSDYILPNSAGVRPVAESPLIKPHITGSKPPSAIPAVESSPIPKTAPVLKTAQVLKSSQVSKAHLDVKEDVEENAGSHDISNEKVVKSRQIDEEPPVDLEAQALKLKETLRQEQIAKAKEAEERKKKRAEKLEQKAQIRAKKEAERKEKKKVQNVARATVVNDSISQDEEDTSSGATKQAIPNLDESSKKPAVEVVHASNRGQKGSGLGRRKIPSREVKGPRPSFPPRANKKSAFPMHLWAYITVAVVAFLLAIFLFLRI